MSSMRDIFGKLNELYAQLPNAVGCVGCGKCCKIQHPHCYTVEFYNIMNALEGWTRAEMEELHLACVSNYLSNDLNKPCVFLDKDNKCRIYEHRDYNCRAFGIIPKKIYAKRVAEVKKEFPGIRLGLEKQSDCCGGVHPETYIGGNKLDRIFEQIADLDSEVGVDGFDLKGGSNYMTFHDFYLLHYYGGNQELLSMLTHLKYNCSDSEKADFIRSMRESFLK